MWYIKYFWIKLQIWVLTPLVWVENKYKAYNEIKLKLYVASLCMQNDMKRVK